MGKEIVATNRQARRDFELLDKFECGLELRGSEVKSLRGSKVEISEAYGRVVDNELWLVSMYIPAYAPSGVDTGHEPDRNKKLLMHQVEIRRIKKRLDQDRLTFIPLSVYFLRGRAKVEMALAKRKLKQDRRAEKAERESKLRADRAVKRSVSGKKRA